MILILLILLFFLLILFFLFVFYFYFEIFITTSFIKIKIFKFLIINIKGEKYINLLNKMIPRSKENIMESIDYSMLLEFVHIDEVNIITSSRVCDYPLALITNGIINYILLIINNLINSKIKKYHYSFENGKDNDIKIDIKFHFNIGIILLNAFLIRRKY